MNSNRAENITVSFTGGGKNTRIFSSVSKYTIFMIIKLITTVCMIFVYEMNIFY